MKDPHEQSIDDLLADIIRDYDLDDSNAVRHALALAYDRGKADMLTILAHTPILPPIA